MEVEEDHVEKNRICKFFCLNYSCDTHNDRYN